MDWDGGVEGKRVTVHGPPAPDPEGWATYVLGLAFEYDGDKESVWDTETDEYVPQRLTAVVLETPDKIWKRMATRFGPNFESGKVPIYESAPYKVRFDQKGRVGYLLESQMLRVREANVHFLPTKLRKQWLELRESKVKHKWRPDVTTLERGRRAARRRAGEGLTVRHVPLDQAVKGTPKSSNTAVLNASAQWEKKIGQKLQAKKRQLRVLVNSNHSELAKALDRLSHEHHVVEVVVAKGKRGTTAAAAWATKRGVPVFIVDDMASALSRANHVVAPKGSLAMALATGRRKVSKNVAVYRTSTVVGTARQRTLRKA